MSILLYGERADRTHENHMLRAFIHELKADWEDKNEHLVLIANSMWNGAEIDLVCIFSSAILIVDFKDYSGHLTGTENGPWLIDDIEVKGGSKANPYQQLRSNKFSVIDWLKNNGLLEGRNLGHINAAVVFTGPVSGKPSLSGTVSRWLHTTDLSSCSALLANLASPQLTIYPNDLEAITNTLGVQKIPWDFGQDEISPLVQPSGTPDETEERQAIVVPDSVEENETVCAPSDPDQKVAPHAVPAQKKRFSNIVRSTIAAGGVFLLMAVISQIYPISSQSNSTVPIEHENRAPATTPQRQEPVSIAANTDTPTPPVSMGSLTAYVDTRSASHYLDQETTVCGPVAQVTRFEKGVYLNLDKPYPQQTLTLVVWDNLVSNVESKLGRLDSLVGVDVCASGQVGQYNKILQIQITDASALQLKSAYISVTSKTAEPATAMRIPAHKAPFYVGKEIMACGILSEVSKFSKGLYLNLDKPYPNQTLTLVVWDEHIAPIKLKFGDLNSKIGREFCALGTIEKYKKRLQLQVNNPQFLRLMLP